MQNVLVACADYPSETNRALQFVHVRNKAYLKEGINVIVLNFATNDDYIYEGIKVYSLKSIESSIAQLKEYTLICHAPNIRNHYYFIRKYKKCFKNKIFFFHGHEIVEILKTYPKEYSFLKKSLLKNTERAIYDKVKLRIWKNYFTRIDKKSKLIFVSNCLKDDFKTYVGVNENHLENRTIVINNSVAKVFELNKYDEKIPKLYDFITIRSNIDSSVYCVDLLVDIAKNNKDKIFLLIGKGEYFNNNNKPDNITFINHQMPQEKLIDYINKSKTALMPTRRDSQGVMACELATFGIPMYTSDLDICKEMFSSFDSVTMYSEKEFLCNPLATLGYKHSFNDIFYEKNTIQKEVEMIKETNYE